MKLSYIDILGDGDRHPITAEITTSHSQSSYGQPVIVLPDGGLLDATSWVLMAYQVVRATEVEYQLLRRWLSLVSFFLTGGNQHDMAVEEAVDLAAHREQWVTARAIRLAAKRGHIPGAKKVGRDWLIPYDGFSHYLDHRPKPGRKPK
jgi:hypothetical protein